VQRTIADAAQLADDFLEGEIDAMLEPDEEDGSAGVVPPSGGAGGPSTGPRPPAPVFESLPATDDLYAPHVAYDMANTLTCFFNGASSIVKAAHERARNMQSPPPADIEKLAPTRFLSTYQNFQSLVRCRYSMTEVCQCLACGVLAMHRGLSPQSRHQHGISDRLPSQVVSGFTKNADLCPEDSKRKLPTIKVPHEPFISSQGAISCSCIPIRILMIDPFIVFCRPS
jgi:hypothetical protein